MACLVLIPLSLLLMVLLFNRRIPLVMARTMWGPWVLWASGIQTKVTGYDNVESDQSYIYVSNHMSFLDIPVLFKVLPVNIHFVAKKEVMYMPFIGWFMWATGMIFIDRKNREKAIVSLERAGRLIKNGKNVLVFPEGTRSTDGQVGNLKKGAFKLAASGDIGIVPIAISGTDRILPAKSSRITPGDVRVTIGNPVFTKGQEDITFFMEEVRQSMVALKEKGDALLLKEK